MKICKACKGTRRLSTYVIDGEDPEGWVECPFCALRTRRSLQAIQSDPMVRPVLKHLANLPSTLRADSNGSPRNEGASSCGDAAVADGPPDEG